MADFLSEFKLVLESYPTWLVWTCVAIVVIALGWVVWKILKVGMVVLIATLFLAIAGFIAWVMLFSPSGSAS